MLIDGKREGVRSAGRHVLRGSLRLFSAGKCSTIDINRVTGTINVGTPSLCGRFPDGRTVFSTVLRAASTRCRGSATRVSIRMRSSRGSVPIFSRVSRRLLIRGIQRVFLCSLRSGAVDRFHQVVALRRFHSPGFTRLLSGHCMS